MTPGPPSLEDLVRAICEGKTIDWDALEREGSPGFSNKLAALRVVESIARVHRTAVPESGAAPEETTPQRRGVPAAVGSPRTAWTPRERRIRRCVPRVGLEARS